MLLSPPAACTGPARAPDPFGPPLRPRVHTFGNARVHPHKIHTLRPLRPQATATLDLVQRPKRMRCLGQPAKVGLEGTHPSYPTLRLAGIKASSHPTGSYSPRKTLQCITIREPVYRLCAHRWTVLVPPVTQQVRLACALMNSRIAGRWTYFSFKPISHSSTAGRASQAQQAAS
jgi:hypothetical protein